MEAWRFTLELETEAETEEEAVANIQQELNRSSNYHPADIGEWERIEPEPYDALGDPEAHGMKL